MTIRSLIGAVKSGKSRVLASLAIEDEGRRFLIPSLDGTPRKRELWDARVGILELPKTPESFLEMMQRLSGGTKLFVDGFDAMLSENLPSSNHRDTVKVSLLCAAFSIARARNLDLTITETVRIRDRDKTFSIAHPWDQTDEVWLVKRLQPSKIWEAGPSKLDVFGVLLDGELL